MKQLLKRVSLSLSNRKLFRMESYLGQNSKNEFHVVALKQTHRFTCSILLKSISNSSMEFSVFSRNILTDRFVTPQKVFSWGYVPPPPASNTLLKQCRSLIKRLNELRGLINQVPNICSFQPCIIRITWD